MQQRPVTRHLQEFNSLFSASGELTREEKKFIGKIIGQVNNHIDAKAEHFDALIANLEILKTSRGYNANDVLWLDSKINGIKMLKLTIRQ